MTTDQLFPELVCEVPDALPLPCKWPLFVVGYYKSYWSIKSALEFPDVESPGLKSLIKALRERGWTHITVLRLPPGDHPWNAK